MSATSAVDFTYRYAFPSAIGETARGFGLRLATCGARQEQPYFFEGRLLRPREVGEMLLVLSNVVRTHFFLPRPPNLDPVVTCGDSMLRFEGFSGCCGVYARVDLPAEGFEAERQGHGTTNVDFNSPLRSALARLGERDMARLAVGCDRVEVDRGQESIVEKKVKLPLRWIKGSPQVTMAGPIDNGCGTAANLLENVKTLDFRCLAVRQLHSVLQLLEERGFEPRFYVRRPTQCRQQGLAGWSRRAFRQARERCLALAAVFHMVEHARPCRLTQGFAQQAFELVLWRTK